MQQIEIPPHVNKGYLAAQLWPNQNKKSRVAKFHNKLNQLYRMKFTDDELKIIEDLLK